MTVQLVSRACLDAPGFLPAQGVIMKSRIDLFDNAYANFTASVLAQVRAEAFGQDIGQNSWVTADEYEKFVGWLKLDEQSHVLEIASGSGGPALHLAGQTGCCVMGIDVNAHGVATAREAAKRAGLAERVTFEVADASHTLPVIDGEFDALLCIDSMNHFPQRLQTLKEWRRVVAPGARAVFTDPVAITGPVTNDELAQRSSIGLFVFVPRAVNEQLIVDAGWTLVEQVDVTDNAAVISRRWQESRRRFSEELRRIEGEERFEGVQRFLGAVHRLTSERRLSRIAYVVENPK